VKGILFASLTLLLSIALPASSAPITFATPIIVNGTDVFSGPSITVIGNFDDMDTLSLRADGLVDLANGNFTANAAGVIVSPAVTNTGDNPGEVTLSGAFPYASLLIGNITLGFFPVFPADASAGFGNPAPPNFVEISNRSLGDIFGAGVMISNGDMLEFRVHDINTGDNSGFYELTQGVSAIPEPTTGLTLMLGLAAALVVRRRYRRLHAN
jgi:hypothetical protein